MSSIITVENISKQFIIGHEATEKYTTLRDVVSKRARKLFSFHGKTATTHTQSTKEVFHALKDVNFTVEQGTLLGIIGRNGAGKSTLLKILSRITEPSAGRIHIKGRIASLLEVGTGFHPELSGRENIFLNGAILGMGRAEIRRKFDEIVDFAEVEKFLDTPVKHYSSGMYVRLAFAVAAHLEPEILIVDEVLAVGDAQFQKKCLGKMENVSKNDGRTVLFVSHNMGVLKKLCDRAIYLQKGQMIGDGKVQDIISMYLSTDNDNSQDDDSDTVNERPNSLCSITVFRVVNRLNERSKEFFFREEMKMEIDLVVKSHLTQVIFDVRIVNTLGDVVAYAYTRETYSFRPGNVRLTIAINSQLLPGEYTINFGIHKNSGQTLYYLESAKRINVHATAVNQAFDYPFEWIPGNIQLDSEWKIVQ
jgi:lipopolysaccharide transport system ATP-binding protein